MGRLLEVDGVQFADANLIPVWEKVRAGERLTHGEGVTILETDDFAAAGKMADFAKKRVSGDKVYFVLNRHINPTNICVLSCKFCDFAKKPGHEAAYEMSIDEILECPDLERNEGKARVGAVDGRLTFEDVSFTYPESRTRAVAAST